MQKQNSVEVPNVSHDELESFHQAHFSSAAVATFRQQFVNPPDSHNSYGDDEQGSWEDEADLGYYEDGVKRTLTDEQIEIFRHSELRELEKLQQKSKEKYPGHSLSEPSDGTSPSLTQSSILPSNFQSSNKRKKKKKQARSQNQEPKPDLRKRTWDVVEAGLDSLDYD